MHTQEIASVAIYPAIGIARVGNSPNAYFVGPTVPGQAARDAGEGKGPFRDAQGRIKRQAAKFFIYALDAEGNILGELNESHGVQIDWRVDVANKKSAWYQFDLALDTNAAAGKYDLNGNATPKGLPVLSQFRNREYTGEERKLLMIEARARRITGSNTNAAGGEYVLKGKIGRNETEVYLGELRTDAGGHLLFLGGRGHSASFTDPVSPITTFANNEGWHDDTSDGPVDARVTLPDGRTLDALGAWVVVAPPDYAVGVPAFSTGYDLLEDVACKKHPVIQKKRPAFYAEILPVLQYLTQNQWVNAGVSRDWGWGSAYDFTHPAFIERLADPSPAAMPLRRGIFDNFRNPAYQVMQPQAWPPLYGDSVTFNISSTDPEQWFAITALKYGYLEQWALGNFEVDKPVVVKDWDDMTPTEQANGLTRAALEQTLGGPFHPGCEFTWPMRHAMMYDDEQPFRIKRRAGARENYGVALSPDIALAAGGPLDGSSPGDITKWMAVPWQTDTSSCLSAYRGYAGEYLPTFWPARVPNDVLTEDDYAKLNDPSASDADRLAAFLPSNRKKWLRDYIYNDKGGFYYGASITDRLKGVMAFTHHWPEIGIITRQEVNDPGTVLPDNVWVETGRTYDPKEEETGTTVRLRGIEPLETTEKNVESPPVPDWARVNPRKLR